MTDTNLIHYFYEKSDIASATDVLKISQKQWARLGKEAKDCIREAIVWNFLQDDKLFFAITYYKVPKKLVDEVKHQAKTGIPRCIRCKLDFVQVNEHEWRPNCNCYIGDVRLCIG